MLSLMDQRQAPRQTLSRIIIHSSSINKWEVCHMAVACRSGKSLARLQEATRANAGVISGFRHGTSTFVKLTTGLVQVLSYDEAPV